MKLLVFDTETTGLPPRNLKKTGKWWLQYPNIVQLSWILYDTEKQKILLLGDNIIKLDGGKLIPEESTAVHRITNEMMNEHGISIQDALVKFNLAYEACDYLIAHNLEFDKQVMIAEMHGNGMVPIFDLMNRPEVCTMKSNIDFCKIERKNRYGKVYYKWPRLEELHYILFKQTPKDLHNAINDVLICLRCCVYQTFNQDIRTDSHIHLKRVINKLF